MRIWGNQSYPHLGSNPDLSTHRDNVVKKRELIQSTDYYFRTNLNKYCDLIGSES